MRIILSPHALLRMQERNIGKDTAYEAVRAPDKVELSRKTPNRILVKKVYYHRTLKKDHLLLIVCEKAGNTLEVVTIIDTSKISKYF